MYVCYWLVYYDINLQYPMYHCIIPMLLLLDNSDSPSIVEQSQQGCDSICHPLLTIIPGSMMYPMPYACQLASSNVGISCSVLLSLVSMYPYIPMFCPSQPFYQLGLCSSFYLRCFIFTPWDSLSDYVHPGIACLAFWASNWAHAFWVWFVIGYLC